MYNGSMENEELNKKDNINDNMSAGVVAEPGAGSGDVVASNMVKPSIEKPRKPQNKQTLLAVIIGIVVGVILIVCVIAALGGFNGGDSDNESSGSDSGSDSGSSQVVSNNTITESGTYEITGESECVSVKTSGDVKLILNNATITCETGPAIYIEEAGKVEIELTGENTISATTTDDYKGAIYAEVDFTLSGDGSLNVTSNLVGIMSTTDITINGGKYVLRCDDNGIRANGKVEINGGEFDIDTGGEGIEATYVLINDGTISITADDDGINGSDKSDAYDIKVEINGGDITIVMATGDTDAIDSNGDLVITGGTLNITAQSPFDYDGTATHTGGTLIVNGEAVDKITNQFEGEMGSGGEPGMGGPGQTGM